MLYSTSWDLTSHCLISPILLTCDTHIRFTALCPGLSGWAGTRKVKPIWILLKQETVSGSGISWVVCKSAPHSRQITMPAPHHSVFYRLDALLATQPTALKHWRHPTAKEISASGEKAPLTSWPGVLPLTPLRALHSVRERMCSIIGSCSTLATWPTPLTDTSRAPGFCYVFNILYCHLA